MEMDRDKIASTPLIVEGEGEGMMEPTASKRTSAKKKAHELARHLRGERPDYAYLKELFRYLRTELAIEVPKASYKLPYVPSEAELQCYWQAVWQAENFRDMVLIKLLLYTGVRVSELCNIHLSEVDIVECQIKITSGKGHKDRVVPFPPSFKEALAMHMRQLKESGADYLFESSWKKKYTERGVRKILERYSKAAGLAQVISPHQLRHFLLTWLKKQGIDDALIQPYSGHASRQALEIYSKLALTEAQREYNRVIGGFPI
jgi:integrase/recombinase XerD